VSGDIADIKFADLVGACHERGVMLVCYCKDRDPWEQARLWRRSRSPVEVAEALRHLKDSGAPFLAACLDEVGPQRTGPRVTGALPGLSWHQWGQAADFCPVGPDGEFLWEDAVGFQILAEEAKRVGLFSGAFWHFPDRPHVQLQAANPSQIYSLSDIDAQMRSRYGM